MNQSVVTVALTLSVDHPKEVAMQTLLDHIGQATEEAYRRIEAEGLVTPNSDEFEEVSVSLNDVTAKDTTHAQQIICNMRDWRIGECDEEMEPGDDVRYVMDAAIGNQCYLDIRCPGDDSKYLGVALEIGNGRPKMFITDHDGGDIVLHIAQSPQGLVVTPDCRTLYLKSAPANRYSYDGASNALIAERDEETIYAHPPREPQFPPDERKTGSIEGKLIPGTSGDTVTFEPLFEMAENMASQISEGKQPPQDDWLKLVGLLKEASTNSDFFPPELAEIIGYTDTHDAWENDVIASWPNQIVEALEDSDWQYSWRYNRSSDSYHVFKVKLSGEEDTVAESVETIATVETIIVALSE